MTIGEWLASRQPPPPAPLLADIRAALGASIDDDAANAATVFLVAAERMLRAIVADGSTDRAVAAPLLTVDALTTYALESASESVQTLSSFSDDAIRQFSSVQTPDERSKP